MPTRIVLTYRDYEALPADGRRYELHDGELFVTAAPGLQHQRLVGNIFALLREHVGAEHVLPDRKDRTALPLRPAGTLPAQDRDLVAPRRQPRSWRCTATRRRSQRWRRSADRT